MVKLDGDPVSTVALNRSFAWLDITVDPDELEWNEESVKWLVDGNEYASTQITDEERTEFHQEFFILLNVAVGGEWAGRPDDSTIFPQYMYVDWVRIYQQ